MTTPPNAPPQKVDNNWWQNYFAEPWQLMREHVKTDYETEIETDFIDWLMQQHGYNSLLDVPSSSGRIALNLAEKGYAVTALDYQQYLLDIGKKNNVNKLPITWQQGDMRNMKWQSAFDCIACIFGSFGYFTDQGNYNFLESAYRALKPGGGMLIETHTLETFINQYQPQAYWKLDEVYVLEERNYQPSTSRMQVNWTVITPNKRVQAESTLRIYSHRELIQICSEIGFKNFEAYGSPFGDPFELGDERLWLFMQK